MRFDSFQHQKRRWIYGIIVFAMMAVVFLFSAMSGKDSSAMSGQITKAVLHAIYPDYDSLPQPQKDGAFKLMNYLVRKGAHFSEYALLGALLMLFLDTFSFKHRPAIALLSNAIYAASDEWHQGFVAGRGPMLTDVLIDTSGALLGIFMLCLLLRAFRQQNKSPEERIADLNLGQS